MVYTYQNNNYGFRIDSIEILNLKFNFNLKRSPDVLTGCDFQSEFDIHAYPLFLNRIKSSDK